MHGEDCPNVSDSQLPTVRSSHELSPFSDSVGASYGSAQDGGETDTQLLLGRYRLIKQLGSGAFGSVWSARDERLERDVAVKILPRGRVVHERFEREARTAARLSHPAIVTLYEAAVDDDGAYLVSELVRGRTLAELLTAGKLSDREIIEIGIGIAEALDHAHSLGVIHRDVKPSNILVAARSSSSLVRAKLTDFGIAHVIDDDSLTRTGEVLGTLAYMAPEQAEGRAATASSDLYSLALVLYESLTGINPLNGVYDGALPRRGRRAPVFVPPIRRQRRDLGRALAAGIDTALRPRSEARGTLEELRAALLAALDGADQTRGVVGGWHGTPQRDADEQLPAVWREDGREAGLEEVPVTRRSGRGVTARRSVPGHIGLPHSLARAANAAAVAFGAVWLCAHLLHAMPLAPATLGLVAALVALAVPALTSAVGAVALGSVGLAGAVPALVALLERRWWRRALYAAVAYLVLAGVSEATRRELYWLPHQLSVAEPQSLISTRGLLGAPIWSAAATLAPLLRTRRWPSLDLVLAVLWSGATLAAVEAIHPGPLHDPLAGAGLGLLIIASPALVSLALVSRAAAGNPAPLA